MNVQDQEGVKTVRRSLRTLRHPVTDRENLVVRSAKSLKRHLTQETVVDGEVKKKKLSSKETQASFENKDIVDIDLTNPDGASEKYWQILAEKRQAALEETLDENEKLRKIIEDLEEEKTLYEEMLREANAFVDVIKDELANTSNDDTGIDVNDVSTENDSSVTEGTADEVSKTTSERDP